MMCYIDFEFAICPTFQLWVGPGSKAAQEKQFFDSHLAPFYRIEQVLTMGHVYVFLFDRPPFGLKLCLCSIYDILSSSMARLLSSAEFNIQSCYICYSCFILFG